MTLRGVATAALGLFVASCAPNYHKVELLRYSHPDARLEEESAADRCLEQVEQGPQPHRRFTSDGCTLWPDASFTGTSWQRCCIEHDIAYWCGGTTEQRCEADRQLLRCVSTEYGAWMGAIMWSATRVAGHPLVPAYWRWGYGHDYPAGF